jgi:hypothetical protein
LVPLRQQLWLWKHYLNFSKNERLYGTDKPAIKVNGAEIRTNNSVGSAFKNGENTISVNYPTQRGLPYKLDYEYYTLKAPKVQKFL